MSRYSMRELREPTLACLNARDAAAGFARNRLLVRRVFERQTGVVPRLDPAVERRCAGVAAALQLVDHGGDDVLRISVHRNRTIVRQRKH